MSQQDLFAQLEALKAPKPVSLPAKGKIIPRPYQAASVKSAFERWDSGDQTTLICLPTGCGKSIVFSEVMRQFHEANSTARMMVLAHRTELILQAKQHAINAGLTAGIEMAHERARREAVIVSSVQTQNAASKCRDCRGDGCDFCDGIGKVKRMTRFRPNDFELLVIDEAHHCPAKSYRSVLEYYKQNPNLKVLLVTATPKRADGIGMHNVCDSVAYEMQLEKAINDGWLVPVKPRIINVESLDLSRVKKQSGDLQAKGVERAFLGEDDIEEQKLLHSVAKPTIDQANGQPALVFCAGQEHAEKLTAAFNAYDGVTAECVIDKTDKIERRRIIERYKSGQTQILVNCMVFCLDEKTEILTRQGWVGPDEITKFHEVANWDNGKVFFKEPKRIVDRLTKPHERFYEISSLKRSVRVTGKHRIVYAKRRNSPWLKSPVEELVGKNYIIPVCGRALPEPMVINQRTESPSEKRFARLVSSNSYNLRQKGIGLEESKVEAANRIKQRYGLRDLNPSELTKDHCRFIGYWMGDGSKTNLKSGGIEYTLCQSAAQPGVVSWVDGVISRCGFDSIKKINKSDHLLDPVVIWSLPRGTGFGPQNRVGVYPIEQYLEKIGSDYLWGLNEQQFDAFVEGLWMADGDHGRDGIPKKPTLTIYNTEKAMLDLVQAIAVTRGWSATLRPRKKRSNLHRVLWTLTLRKKEHYCVNSTIGNGFEAGELGKPERAWCVQTESKNIITRRNGFVTVMGNTEGFDAPKTAVVANARPTKSESLLLQIIGRGTRPLAGIVDGPPTAEARRKAIAESDKPYCVVIDFVGNLGRNEITTSLDLLAGDDVEPIDLKEALKLAESEEHEVDIEEVLEKVKAAREEQERKAEEEQELKRSRYRAKNISYTADEVAMFLKQEFDPEVHYTTTPDGPSKGQVKFLIALGWSPEAACGVTKRQASGIISKNFKLKEGEAKFTFGKHAGKKIKQCPRGYIEWAAGNLTGDIAKRCEEFIT